MRRLGLLVAIVILALLVAGGYTATAGVAVYQELAPRCERILSLQLSSTLSGTFASANGADQMRTAK